MSHEEEKVDCAALPAKEEAATSSALDHDTSEDQIAKISSGATIMPSQTETDVRDRILKSSRDTTRRVITPHLGEAKQREEDRKRLKKDEQGGEEEGDEEENFEPLVGESSLGEVGVVRVNGDLALRGRPLKRVPRRLPRRGELAYELNDDILAIYPRNIWERQRLRARSEPRRLGSPDSLSSVGYCWRCHEVLSSTSVSPVQRARSPVESNDQQTALSPKRKLSSPTSDRTKSASLGRKSESPKGRWGSLGRNWVSLGRNTQDPDRKLDPKGENSSRTKASGRKLHKTLNAFGIRTWEQRILVGSTSAEPDEYHSNRHEKCKKKGKRDNAEKKTEEPSNDEIDGALSEKGKLEDGAGSIPRVPLKKSLKVIESGKGSIKIPPGQQDEDIKEENSFADSYNNKVQSPLISEENEVEQVDPYTGKRRKVRRTRVERFVTTTTETRIIDESDEDDTNEPEKDDGKRGEDFSALTPKSTQDSSVQEENDEMSADPLQLNHDVISEPVVAEESESASSRMPTVPVAEVEHPRSTPEAQTRDHVIPPLDEATADTKGELEKPVESTQVETPALIVAVEEELPSTEGSPAITEEAEGAKNKSKSTIDKESKKKSKSGFLGSKTWKRLLGSNRTEQDADLFEEPKKREKRNIDEEEEKQSIAEVEGTGVVSSDTEDDTKSVIETPEVNIPEIAAENGPSTSVPEHHTGAQKVETLPKVGGSKQQTPVITEEDEVEQVDPTTGKRRKVRRTRVERSVTTTTETRIIDESDEDDTEEPEKNDGKGGEDLSADTPNGTQDPAIQEENDKAIADPLQLSDNVIPSAGKDIATTEDDKSIVTSEPDIDEESRPASSKMPTVPAVETGQTRSVFEPLTTPLLRQEAPATEGDSVEPIDAIEEAEIKTSAPIVTVEKELPSTEETPAITEDAEGAKDKGKSTIDKEGEKKFKSGILGSKTWKRLLGSNRTEQDADPSQADQCEEPKKREKRDLDEEEEKQSIGQVDDAKVESSDTEDDAKSVIETPEVNIPEIAAENGPSTSVPEHHTGAQKVETLPKVGGSEQQTPVITEEDEVEQVDPYTGKRRKVRRTRVERFVTTTTETRIIDESDEDDTEEPEKDDGKGGEDLSADTPTSTQDSSVQEENDEMSADPLQLNLDVISEPVVAEESESASSRMPTVPVAEVEHPRSTPEAQTRDHVIPPLDEATADTKGELEKPVESTQVETPAPSVVHLQKPSPTEAPPTSTEDAEEAKDKSKSIIDKEGKKKSKSLLGSKTWKRLLSSNRTEQDADLVEEPKEREQRNIDEKEEKQSIAVVGDAEVESPANEVDAISVIEASQVNIPEIAAENGPSTSVPEHHTGAQRVETLPKVDGSEHQAPPIVEEDEVEWVDPSIGRTRVERSVTTTTETCMNEESGGRKGGEYISADTSMGTRDPSILKETDETSADLSQQVGSVIPSAGEGVAATEDDENVVIPEPVFAEESESASSRMPTVPVVEVEHPRSTPEAQTRDHVIPPLGEETADTKGEPIRSVESTQVETPAPSVVHLQKPSPTEAPPTSTEDVEEKSDKSKSIIDKEGKKKLKSGLLGSKTWKRLLGSNRSEQDADPSQADQCEEPKKREKRDLDEEEEKQSIGQVDDAKVESSDTEDDAKSVIETPEVNIPEIAAENGPSTSVPEHHTGAQKVETLPKVGGSEQQTPVITEEDEVEQVDPTTSKRRKVRRTRVERSVTTTTETRIIDESDEDDTNEPEKDDGKGGEDLSADTPNGTQDPAIQEENDKAIADPLQLSDNVIPIAGKGVVATEDKSIVTSEPDIDEESRPASSKMPTVPAVETGQTRSVFEPLTTPLLRQEAPATEGDSVEPIDAIEEAEIKTSAPIVTVEKELPSTEETPAITEDAEGAKDKGKSTIDKEGEKKFKSGILGSKTWKRLLGSNRTEQDADPSQADQCEEPKKREKRDLDEEEEKQSIGQVDDAKVESSDTEDDAKSVIEAPRVDIAEVTTIDEPFKLTSELHADTQKEEALAKVGGSEQQTPVITEEDEVEQVDPTTGKRRKVRRTRVERSVTTTTETRVIDESDEGETYELSKDSRKGRAAQSAEISEATPSFSENEEDSAKVVVPSLEVKKEKNVEVHSGGTEDKPIEVLKPVVLERSRPPSSAAPSTDQAGAKLSFEKADHDQDGNERENKKKSKSKWRHLFKPKRKEPSVHLVGGIMTNVVDPANSRVNDEGDDAQNKVVNIPVDAAAHPIAEQTTRALRTAHQSLSLKDEKMLELQSPDFRLASHATNQQFSTGTAVESPSPKASVKRDDLNLAIDPGSSALARNQEGKAAALIKSLDSESEKLVKNYEPQKKVADLDDGKILIDPAVSRAKPESHQHQYFEEQNQARDAEMRLQPSIKTNLPLGNDSGKKLAEEETKSTDSSQWSPSSLHERDHERAKSEKSAICKENQQVPDAPSWSLEPSSKDKPTEEALPSLLPSIQQQQQQQLERQQQYDSQAKNRNAEGDRKQSTGGYNICDRDEHAKEARITSEFSHAKEHSELEKVQEGLDEHVVDSSRLVEQQRVMDKEEEAPIGGQQRRVEKTKKAVTEEPINEIWSKMRKLVPVINTGTRLDLAHESVKHIDSQVSAPRELVDGESRKQSLLAHDEASSEPSASLADKEVAFQQDDEPFKLMPQTKNIDNKNAQPSLTSTRESNQEEPELIATSTSKQSSTFAPDLSQSQCNKWSIVSSQQQQKQQLSARTDTLEDELIIREPEWPKEIATLALKGKEKSSHLSALSRSDLGVAGCTKETVAPSLPSVRAEITTSHSLDLLDEHKSNKKLSKKKTEEEEPTSKKEPGLDRMEAPSSTSGPSSGSQASKREPLQPQQQQQQQQQQSSLAIPVIVDPTANATSVTESNNSSGNNAADSKEGNKWFNFRALSPSRAPAEGAVASPVSEESKASNLTGAKGEKSEVSEKKDEPKEAKPAKDLPALGGEKAERPVDSVSDRAKTLPPSARSSLLTSGGDQKLTSSPVLGGQAENQPPTESASRSGDKSNAPPVGSGKETKKEGATGGSKWFKFASKTLPRTLTAPAPANESVKTSLVSEAPTADTAGSGKSQEKVVERGEPVLDNSKIDLSKVKKKKTQTVTKEGNATVVTVVETYTVEDSSSENSSSSESEVSRREEKKTKGDKGTAPKTPWALFSPKNPKTSEQDQKTSADGANESSVPHKPVPVEAVVVVDNQPAKAKTTPDTTEDAISLAPSKWNIFSSIAKPKPTSKLEIEKGPETISEAIKQSKPTHSLANLPVESTLKNKESGQKNNAESEDSDDDDEDLRDGTANSKQRRKKKPNWRERASKLIPIGIPYVGSTIAAVPLVDDEAEENESIHRQKIDEGKEGKEKQPKSNEGGRKKRSVGSPNELEGSYREQLPNGSSPFGGKGNKSSIANSVVVPFENEEPERPYPKKVFFIVGNEFCERFSYYGLRTVLVLYFKHVLGYSDNLSTVSFHIFATLCYLTPIFGAILGDSVWGKYKTILRLSIVYFIGELILLLSSIMWNAGNLSQAGTFLGLFLIGIGTGGIKPCVSALGGDQFFPNEERRRKGFFSLFYAAINLGSMLSMLITPILRSEIHCVGRQDCYPLAFGVPAILMLVAILVFIMAKNQYHLAPLPVRNILLAFGEVICTAMKHKFKSMCSCGSQAQRDGYLRSNYLNADNLTSSSQLSLTSNPNAMEESSNGIITPAQGEIKIQSPNLREHSLGQNGTAVESSTGGHRNNQPERGELSRRGMASVPLGKAGRLAPGLGSHADQLGGPLSSNDESLIPITRAPGRQQQPVEANPSGPAFGSNLQNGNAAYCSNKMLCDPDGTLSNGQWISGKSLAGNNDDKNHWLHQANDKYDANLIEDFRVVLRLLLLFLPIPVFWCLFDQQNSIWTLQASRMDGSIFNTGINVKPDQMSVINPILMLIAIPLFDIFIYPACKRVNFLAGPVSRMTVGGMFAAAAFVAAGMIELHIQAQNPGFAPPTKGVNLLLVNGLSNCYLHNASIAYMQQPGLNQHQQLLSMNSSYLPNPIESAILEGETKAIRYDDFAVIASQKAHDNEYDHSTTSSPNLQREPTGHEYSSTKAPKPFKVSVNSTLPVPMLRDTSHPERTTLTMELPGSSTLNKMRGKRFARNEDESALSKAKSLSPYGDSNVPYSLFYKFSSFIRPLSAKTIEIVSEKSKDPFKNYQMFFNLNDGEPDSKRTNESSCALAPLGRVELLIGTIPDKSLKMIYLFQDGDKVTYRIYNESRAVPNSDMARVRLLYEYRGNVNPQESGKGVLTLRRKADLKKSDTITSDIVFKGDSVDGRLFLSYYVDVDVPSNGDVFYLDCVDKPMERECFKHSLRLDPGTRNLLILKETKEGGLEMKHLLLQDKSYQVSVFYQFIPYTLISISEVMFSITGLEFSYSMAPESMKSLILGAWSLTTAFGNILTVTLESLHLFSNIAYDFLFYALLMFLDMLLFYWIGRDFE